MTRVKAMYGLYRRLDDASPVVAGYYAAVSVATLGIARGLVGVALAVHRCLPASIRDPVEVELSARRDS